MTDIFEPFKQFLGLIQSMLPFGATLLLCIAVLYLANLFLTRQAEKNSELRFRRQLLLIVLTLLAMILVIIALPIEADLRGQLFSLLGILVSAIIALSSTTFVGNIMAGIMLRSFKSFRIGDFVRVEENFGRVSAVDLLHVEIQTEDRDLMTIPNLYLVSRPVKVLHSAGTIISTEVSLGYDIAHKQVSKLLIEAAQEAGLEDPFVQILELGNYSINYRIGGLLKEVKQVLSSRSRLRENVVEKLHRHHVEIASPTLMNTRQMAAGSAYIPSGGYFSFDDDPEQAKLIEDVVFDKAEKAASLEGLKKKYKQKKTDIEKLKEQLKAVDGDERESIKNRIERMELLAARIKIIVDREIIAEKTENPDGA